MERLNSPRGCLSAAGRAGRGSSEHIREPVPYLIKSLVAPLGLSPSSVPLPAARRVRVGTRVEATRPQRIIESPLTEKLLHCAARRGSVIFQPAAGPAGHGQATTHSPRPGPAASSWGRGFTRTQWIWIADPRPGQVPPRATGRPTRVRDKAGRGHCTQPTSPYPTPPRLTLTPTLAAQSGMFNPPGF